MKSMNIGNLWKFRYVFIIFCIFLCSCTNEYHEHFLREHDSGDIIVSAEYQPSSGAQLYTLPDKSVRDSLIQEIQKAQKRIWIEIYLWTDAQILDAVLDAHKRGVDVRVLLESNVYSLPRANKKIYDALKKANIEVLYTDNYRYVFTHAKFFIVDDRYYISTGNFTRSFFEWNREFIYSDRDLPTLSFLEDVLLSDFQYNNVSSSKIPSHIVLSPINSRTQVQSLIQSAEHEIIIYNQTITDNQILDFLDKKNGENVAVSLCTADNDSNSEKKSAHLFRWEMLKKPYLHAKVMIIDKKTLFLWSQNFTSNALENNREVGIIIRNNSYFLEKILWIIQKDCFSH